jgi:hypothetical protein
VLALGHLCVILGVVVTSSSFLEVPAKYENLLVFSMGIAGASAGALLIKESGEEKARRLEIAASKIEDNPNLAGFRQNIQEEHRLTTLANALETAKLDKGVRQQYLLQAATQPEFNLGTRQQIPQIEQIPAAPPEEQ